MDEADVAVLWPSRLLLPPRPPLLIYLDLNHWISLAKAATGHRDGHRFAGCLATARDARSSGAALFPLSGSHYMELSGIQDPAQRQSIATVMEELSGFATLLSRPTVMRLEIAAVLDDRLRPSRSAYEPVHLVGHGVSHAFGKKGTLHITDDFGHDVTKTLSAAQRETLRHADLQVQQAMLAGPPDDKVAELRERGWDPTAARRIARSRADEEREQVARLDAEVRWRRGRLRDVVGARELLIELPDMLDEALEDRELTLAGVIGDRERARTFLRSMPTTDVSIDLKTEMHRNGQRAARWSANDVFDMDALSLAVPYCDVVVTENHSHDALTRSGSAATRYKTEVFRDLRSLEARLRAVAEPD